jgi:uncharacterized protein
LARLRAVRIYHTALPRRKRKLPPDEETAKHSPTGGRRSDGRLRPIVVRAWFRFYAELNDFLPPERRQIAFVHSVDRRSSVKDAIESLGVPHTEIDLILVDGRSVDFSYLLQDGDRVSVYPVFEALDISPVALVRPVPLREVRFVLDTHLGRLAAYLRLAGFDARWRSEAGDAELAGISVEEKRILLTRDHGLLKRKVVTHGYFVRATRPADQLAEVLGRFDLVRSVVPFSRCLRCNGEIESAAPELAWSRLPPRIRATHREFWRCRSCGRVYWKGSHHARLARLVEAALAAVGGRGENLVP